MRKCVDGQRRMTCTRGVQQLRNALIVREQPQEDDNAAVGRNAERRAESNNLGVIPGPGPKKARVHGIGECE